MGVYFVVQTTFSMFFSDQSENAPAQQAKKSYSYEEAVEQQKRDGGPRRYYGDDELDIQSAQVADADGNPVRSPDPKPKKTTGHAGRDYIHVNVAYCTS